MSSYIATLDLSDFMDNGANVKITVSETGGNWKGNWIFEGAVFVPAASLENIPLFIQLGKDPAT